jgi:hypothetical protein
MRHKLAQDPLDRRIAALARRQHGVISRAQLLSLGLGGSGVAHRVRAGRLHRIHRGVYAVGHARITASGLYLAAVLACGEGAVMSHRAAAALWCIRPSNSRVVDVTIPGRAGRARRKGVRIHRARLRPDEVALVDGIPVTSPARTLVDFADVSSLRELERAFDEAEYLRLDCTGLEPIHGRRGYGRLQTVSARHEPGTTRTRSDLEDLFLALCERFGLPRPAVNSLLLGHEVDFLWRDARLVVEVDGGAAHGTRAAFEEDRRRDAELAVAGQTVVRFTEARLEQAPAAVAAQVGALLRRPEKRRAPAAPPAS